MPMAKQATTRTPELAVTLGWALAIVVTFALVIRGIASGYSYWFDELFSVVHNSASLKTLWEHRSDDVHPPEYPVLLWAWMKLWGQSEIATRSLSAIFAGLAAVTPLLLARRYGKVFAFAASMLIVSNPLAVFYAQETRDYAMLLFGSTLTLCAFLDHRRKLFFAAALLTGLTHYFGTLLAVTLLFLHLLRHPKSVRELAYVAAIGVLLILWPAYQTTRGVAGAALGGNFWITTSSGESVVLAARVMAPQVFWVIAKIGVLGGLVLGLLLVAGFATIARKALRSIRAALARSGQNDRGIAWIVATGVLVILGVAVISLHSPIAIERNYIVLLPIQGLILAWAVDRGLNSWFGWFTLTLFFVYCGLGIYLGILKLEDKTRPVEDWKALAERTASVVRETGLPLYYFVNYPTGEEKFLEFYLPGEIRARPITLQSLQALPGRAVVVLASGCQAESQSHPVTDFFRRSGKAFTAIAFSGWRPCGMEIVSTGAPNGGSDAAGRRALGAIPPSQR